MAIKRILVPVDFSGDSLAALAYTRDLLGPLAAELVLLHVVEPIYYATPADMFATSPNLTLLLDEQQRAATAQLQRITAELGKRKVAHRALVKTGAAAQVIVDTAKSAKADLVVMATHGRTGLAHMLMGSVAEKVVRTAGCPVLTVRGATLKKVRRRTTRRLAARRAQGGTKKKRG